MGALDLFDDLRYGLRRLAKRPAFAVLAALTLALGIGATTATFSVVEGVLLAPLPYAEPERLVTVWSRLTSRDFDRLGYTEAEFLALRAEHPALASVAAWSDAGANLSGLGETGLGAGAEARRITVTRTTAELLPTLEVEPVLGRGFTAAEERPGANRVALLDHGFWQRSFGGRADVLGATVVLDGVAHIVVGVLPRGFRFPESGPEVWVPLALDPEARPGDSYLSVIGRLAPGASVETASTEVDAAAMRFALSSGGEESAADLRRAGWGGFVEPLRESVVGEARPALLVLMGAVALVLLIACANVANLMLVQAVAREGEMAVRGALGAGRGRIVRQLLVESSLVALAGGVLGVGVAAWLLDALAALGLHLLARPVAVGIDGRVLAFALATALGTGLLFGLVPALYALRVNPAAGLAGGGGERGTESARGRRLAGGLVVAEIALSLVLLVGAGLLLRTFAALGAVEPGYRLEDVVTAQVALPEGGRSPAEVREFYRRLGERAAALPGVVAVGEVSDLPLSPTVNSGWGRVMVERPQNPPAPSDPAASGEPFSTVFAQRYAASPGYFAAMGIALVAGRLLDDGDRAGAPPVAVVDESFARRFWPDESPLGRRIATGMSDAPNWRTIVGVVRHVRPWVDTEGRDQVYFAADQWPLPSMHLVVRTRVPPETIVSALRREVAALDPAQPLFDVRTMAARRAESVAPRRFSLLLVAAFAAMALGLAAVGIYGTVAQRVSRRRRELGIRQALGARPGQLLALVLGEGARLGLAGIALGTLGAWWLSRFLASLLFAVTPSDPATYAAVGALLFLVVLAACWAPARRAQRLAPLAALRR